MGMSAKPKSQYDTDFYAWAMETAKLIREHKLSEIDFENVAEEIESVGRSERRELLNRLALILQHLLKSQFQSERRGRSSRSTIMVQRRELMDVLADSPSLRHGLEDRLTLAYEKALFDTVNETGMNKNIFPTLCPYSLKQIFDYDFLPE